MTSSQLNSMDKQELYLTLDELVNACAWDKEWVLALLAEDVIYPELTDVAADSVEATTLYFDSVQLTTIRRASRLRRDFDASPQAIALILDLLQEVQRLRKYQHQQQALQVFFDNN